MEEQRGLARVVNFTDAVVAIAATLLVLPLVDLVGELDHESVRTLLSGNADKIWAFVLSFVVIARFWVVHHRIWSHVRGYHALLVWVNFAWLLSIVFLPFPTEVVGASKTSTTSALLYVGTITVTALTATIEQWLIVRSPELQFEDVRGTLSMTPSLVTSALLLLALALAAIPGVGLWSLLALVPAGVVTRALEHVLGQRPAADAT